MMKHVCVAGHKPPLARRRAQRIVEPIRKPGNNASGGFGRNPKGWPRFGPTRFGASHLLGAYQAAWLASRA